MLSRRKKFKPLLYTVMALAFLAVVGFTVFNQVAKSNEIEQQAARLQDEYRRLQLEAQRLELMREYVNTGEFLERYARERYNLVAENDILFYDVEN